MDMMGVVVEMDRAGGESATEVLIADVDGEIRPVGEIELIDHPDGQRGKVILIKQGPTGIQSSCASCVVPMKKPFLSQYASTSSLLSTFLTGQVGTGTM